MPEVHTSITLRCYPMPLETALRISPDLEEVIKRTPLNQEVGSRAIQVKYGNDFTLRYEILDFLRIGGHEKKITKYSERDLPTPPAEVAKGVVEVNVFLMEYSLTPDDASKLSRHIGELARLPPLMTGTGTRNIVCIGFGCLKEYDVQDWRGEYKYPMTQRTYWPIEGGLELSKYTRGVFHHKSSKRPE